MRTLTLEERICGSLMGAAIGAGLGFARYVHPEQFAVTEPGDLSRVRLEPAAEAGEERGRVQVRSVLPFVNLGVQAYLKKQGRVTPEEFAVLLRDDPEVAAPVFAWDGIHSTQEMLKEGMHPRLSGLASAPCGIIAAAMPAVGIYHFNDPEYAYVDGVELASVAQPRIGADWAALCAAAVAAAFNSNSDPGLVVEAVLKIAHQNSKEVFYQLDRVTRVAGSAASSREDEFIRWWITGPGRGESRKETDWVAFNPVCFVLPLLRRFASQPREFFALLLSAEPASPFERWLGGRAVSAVIGGAVLGALGGSGVFASEWRGWAEPVAQDWFPLAAVVMKRLQREQEIISTTERMMAAQEEQASLLHDKVHGCLLAGAIGNAMGSATEGKFYWEIDREHPNGITTVLDPGRLEGEDDNQMAMLLIECYLEREGLPVTARHFGETWKKRLNRHHFYALCMGNAYDLICRGWDPRITGHWSVVTGSTVMCMEPVGLYHMADPEYAAIDATAVSYMYQRGLDVAAASMLAAATSEALSPDASVESVLKVVLEMAPREPMRTFDSRPFRSPYDYICACLDIAAKYDDVLAVREELYEKCLLYNPIDPLELWGFALAIFAIAGGDVRQAAIGGTNIGRDADTIAGRAAMLSGALRGAKSVPEEWKQLFSPESLDRIKRNAFRFVDQVMERRLARLKKRQVASGEDTARLDRG